MADAVTNDPRVHARGRQAVTKRRLLERHLLPIRRKAGREHSRPGARDVLQLDTAGLKGLIYNLKQLALLWVHPHSFNRRDVEQIRVELIQIAIEEVPAQHAETSWSVVVFMEVSVNVEP